MHIASLRTRARSLSVSTCTYAASERLHHTKRVSIIGLQRVDAVEAQTYYQATRARQPSGKSCGRSGISLAR